MKINLSPARFDTSLTLCVEGDVLVLNGETLDLSAIPNGAMLPAEAVASDWVVGAITRADGELSLTLRLPCGSNAPEETRFPQPITVTEDGLIVLPPYQIEEISA